MAKKTEYAEDTPAMTLDKEAPKAKPVTVGRGVLYVASGKDHAAVVIDVPADNVASLVVFGLGEAATTICREVQIGEGEGCWHWPVLK